MRPDLEYISRRKGPKAIDLFCGQHFVVPLHVCPFWLGKGRDEPISLHTTILFLQSNYSCPRAENGVMCSPTDLLRFKLRNLVVGGKHFK